MNLGSNIAYKYRRYTIYITIYITIDFNSVRYLISMLYLYVSIIQFNESKIISVVKFRLHDIL